MDKELNRILWLTDLHFSPIFITRFFDFLHKARASNVDAIFLTGDISEGFIHYWLEAIAKCISCPIYFCLGNHDHFFASFEDTIKKVSSVCKKYKNLIWLDEQNEPVRLNNEVAVIGARGWYSCDFGTPKYLSWTLDWLLIKELRELPNLNARIEYFQMLADQSAVFIKNQLEKAIEQNYETIYLLSHVPQYKEATRDEGTVLEKFWTPYNVNYRMGQAIQEVMQKHKKRNVICLAGHCHQPEFIRISRNIHCQVGRSCDLLKVNSQVIYL
jgi:predicted MPP superfamily phosphohydrolase